MAVLDMTVAPAASVDIVVLNWNGKADTLACIRSLRRITYACTRLLVVDNGSDDGSVAAINAEFPEVAILSTGRNLGYAGGNNVGIRHFLANGPADHLLLLNNDTTVDPSFIEGLLSVAFQRPRVGIIGPRIYFANDPEIIWFAGARWDERTLSFYHVGLGDREVPKSAGETFDYVTGCALLVRREVLDTVGLLDDRFFLTFEETDFCYRAREHGYECAVADEAKIWHKVSASFGGSDSPMMTYFLTRNRLLFGRMHLALRMRARMIGGVVLDLLFPHLNEHPAPGISRARRIYWLIRGGALFRTSPYRSEPWKAALAGVRDHLIQRYGDCPKEIRTLNEEWLAKRARAVAAHGRDAESVPAHGRPGPTG